MAVYKNRHYLHYVAIGLVIVVLFLLQNSTDILPRLFSVSPLPIIPAVICIAMFERETTGLVVGLISGILMDINSIQICGFNAIVLLILGCGCGLLVTYLFTNSPISAFFLSGCACVAYYLIYFIIFVLFAGVNEPYLYFFRYTLVGALYTWLYTLPIYLILRAMSKRSEKN